MNCKNRAKNCGGCPLLELPYADQLKQKEEKVRALLARYAGSRKGSYALIAGFAAGLLVRFLNGLGKKIPENLQQVRSSFLTPLLSLLGIAALMALAVNPPLGRFNQKLYRALDSMRGGSPARMRSACSRVRGQPVFLV